MIHILLVEDDPTIVEHLSAFLESEGLEVSHCDGQSKALALLESQHFDCVLLDLSLAEGHGFSLCSAIKNTWDIPVIILTASADEYTTLAGFELGADDYVTKPFRPRVLLSRIKNVLRHKNPNSVLGIGNLKIDIDRAKVWKHDQELLLSALEYKLLLVFINNRGMVLSRDVLMEEIWSISGEFVNDNTLSVYIKRLREKIEDNPSNPTYLTTVRGLGYRLEESV